MSRTNKQVIHIWAQNNGASVRSSNGNCSCSNGTLNSYRTVIARFDNSPPDGGEPVCLITTRTYSVTTTGKHMPHSYDVANARVFYVDDVNYNDHAGNLGRMVAAYQKSILTAVRSRKYGDLHLREASDRRRVAMAYAAVYQLPDPSELLPEPTGEGVEQIMLASKAAAAASAKAALLGVMELAA